MQETEWFSVVAWNKLAEQCNQFLNKGKLIYVEGRLRTRSWEGQDGQKRYRTEIIANRVTFLDRQASTSLPEDKSDEAEAGTEAGAGAGAGAGEPEPEDIPF